MVRQLFTDDDLGLQMNGEGRGLLMEDDFGLKKTVN